MTTPTAAEQMAACQKLLADHDGDERLAAVEMRRRFYEDARLYDFTAQAEAAKRKDERIAELEQRHLNELTDLQSCVDNIECDCLDPPYDRGVSDDDYENHSQYCRVYLHGYIGKLIKRCKENKA